MKPSPGKLVLSCSLALLAGCSNEAKNEEQAKPKASAVAPLSANSNDTLDGYSEVYRRIDLSFSDIPIDTRFGTVRDRLTELQIDDCEKYSECDWSDENAVRHYFWPSNDEQNRLADVLVVKLVDAADFKDRPIGALGIGMARDKDQVVENVRRFLPELKLDCSSDRVSQNVGPVECGGSVDPGWFQIGFDKKGRLLAIRFDAYHFT